MPEKGRSPGEGKRAGLPLRDDLMAVGVSALRASGVIGPGSTSVVVRFGEGEEALSRDVRVIHLNFPNGGSWSLFLCPSCGRRVRTLRLYDGRLVCRSCDGLIARCQQVKDRTAVIERLRALLYSGKKLKWRSRAEAALRRALIVERRKRVP